MTEGDHALQKRYLAPELYPLIRSDLSAVRAGCVTSERRRCGRLVLQQLEEGAIKKRVTPNRDIARAVTTGYSETLCNRTRRHSHLDGVGPSSLTRRKSMD